MLDCLINGEILEDLPVTDRGLQYGHGVFETIACDRGQPLFWNLHMLRLDAGCEALHIDPPAEDVLRREVQTVVAGQNQAVAKIILTGGEGERGYAMSEFPQANRIVSSYHWPVEFSANRTSGVHTRICDYRLSHSRLLARIKHLNRLEQVLARAEWDSEDIQEGILLDVEDNVIAATAGNLFLAKGGRLYTPRLDRCGICGVMRDALMAEYIARAEKRRISLAMLADADEVFICNSIRGIWPVTRVDKQEFPIGPLTRELQAWLTEVSPLWARPE